MIAAPRKAAIAIFAFALMLCITCAFVPSSAFADDELDALNEKVTQTAADYDAAVDKIEQIDADIKSNEKKIVELESKIDDAKAESLVAMRKLYKYRRSTSRLITLVFSSSNPADMFKNIEYLNHYQDGLMSQVESAQRLMDDIEQTNAKLAEDREAAEKAKSDASAAMEEAKAARKEAMEKAAAKAAEQAKEESESDTSSEKKERTSVSSGEVNWNVSKSEFISTWTKRIDAYLSGSPLAGQGKTFATAAWNYGVDPRWSPAISLVESGKGANCFKPHNAWGWGSKSWSSWEEAIDAHVSGLARIYGSTISYAAAKKYCPPNYEHWYSTCVSEMRKI